MSFSSYFVGAAEIVEAVEEARPDTRYFSPPLDHRDDEDEDEDEAPKKPPERIYLYGTGKVQWVGSPGCMVEIPAANVLFTEGNTWNFGHAAAILDYLQTGSGNLLEAAAGRIYRVTVAEMKQTQRYERNRELEYQMGMTTPWERADVGSYHAQLLDGNHRVAAALAAGVRSVWVHCGEDYRKNVRKKDLK